MGLSLALLLFQVLQGNSQPLGVVTGRIASSTGMPAASVRVYAIPAGNIDNRDSTILESLTTTDEMGRYRLEVPVGRYFIAVGSVESPTYFPGTADVAAARVLSIASGEITANINFSSFVPAARSIFDLLGMKPPGSTGVLSGVLRYPNGDPAVGVSVVAMSVNWSASQATGTTVTIRSVVSSNGLPGVTILMSPLGQSTATTDATGHYRIEDLSPGTYFIAAGYANVATLYPGTNDIARATRFPTTPTTKIDNLDFTIPKPEAGTSVRGRALPGPMSAGNLTIQMRDLDAVANFPLPWRPDNVATIEADGSFQFQSVLPGRYRLTGSLTGFPSVIREVVVTDQPVAGMELSFPVFVLTGRVLLDDGTAFPDIRGLGGAAVTDSANDISLYLDDMGRFKRVLKHGEYRFYLENLPDDYMIRSITAGTSDLLKETIKVDAITTVNVDVRMARKTDAASLLAGSTAGRVVGKLIDFEGGKSKAESVQICCATSGPVKQFSSRVRLDGSFEVSDIPSGSYTAEVTGPVPLFVVNPNVDVGPQGATVRLMTAEQLIPLLVRIQTENSDPLPGLHMSVTLTSASGVQPIVWEFEEDGIAQPSVPGGKSYAVGLLNVPDGFVVKSISSDDDGDLLHGKRLNVADSPPAFIDVTLVPK